MIYLNALGTWKSIKLFNTVAWYHMTFIFCMKHLDVITAGFLFCSGSCLYFIIVFNWSMRKNCSLTLWKFSDMWVHAVLLEKQCIENGPVWGMIRWRYWVQAVRPPLLLNPSEVWVPIKLLMDYNRLTGEERFRLHSKLWYFRFQALTKNYTTFLQTPLLGSFLNNWNQAYSAGCNICILP